MESYRSDEELTLETSASLPFYDGNFPHTSLFDTRHAKISDWLRAVQFFLFCFFFCKQWKKELILYKKR